VGLFIVDGVIKIMQASVLSLIRSAASVFASGKSKREREKYVLQQMLVHTGWQRVGLCSRRAAGKARKNGLKQLRRLGIQ
jgi:hypothetical protein